MRSLGVCTPPSRGEDAVCIGLIYFRSWELHLLPVWLRRNGKGRHEGTAFRKGVERIEIQTQALGRGLQECFKAVLVRFCRIDPGKLHTNHRPCRNINVRPTKSNPSYAPAVFRPQEIS